MCIMQGPSWAVMTFVVHIVHMYNVVIEKFTICERLYKFEQIILDDSANGCLDIKELHMQFFTHVILSNIHF